MLHENLARFRPQGENLGAQLIRPLFGLALAPNADEGHEGENNATSHRHLFSHRLHR